jgi:hypothetical protein
VPSVAKANPIFRGLYIGFSNDESLEVLLAENTNPVLKESKE